MFKPTPITAINNNHKLFISVQIENNEKIKTRSKMYLFISD